MQQTFPKGRKSSDKSEQDSTASKTVKSGPKWRAAKTLRFVLIVSGLFWVFLLIVLWWFYSA